jgi:hypothetical protein
MIQYDHNNKINKQYLQARQLDIISFNIKDLFFLKKYIFVNKMSLPTLAENVIAVMTQYNIREEDLIKSERITQHFPCNINGHRYSKANLDKEVKTGHTIILVEADNKDLVEKINYFYEHDDPKPGFKVFGDIFGYTNFKFDNLGNKVDGISFVFKHATEWETAFGRRDITKSVNLNLVNIAREFNIKINPKYVQEPINYYNREKIDIHANTFKKFEYNQEDKSKEAYYLEGEFLENNTKVYCVAVDMTRSSNDIVYCIEKMYEDPLISSLFDKIFAHCITKLTGCEAEESLFIIIKAK